MEESDVWNSLNGHAKGSAGVILEIGHETSMTRGV
jgi:hypothetical protein